MASKVLPRVNRLRRQGDAYKEDTIVVGCHPEIAELLSTSDLEYVEQVEKRLQKKVLIKARGSFHLEHFEIIGKKAADKQAGGGERKDGGRPAKKDRDRERGERQERAPERENKETGGDESTTEARPTR